MEHASSQTRSFSWTNWSSKLYILMSDPSTGYRTACRIHCFNLHLSITIFIVRHPNETACLTIDQSHTKKACVSQFPCNQTNVLMQPLTHEREAQSPCCQTRTRFLRSPRTSLAWLPACRPDVAALSATQRAHRKWSAFQNYVAWLHKAKRMVPTKRFCIRNCSTRSPASGLLTDCSVGFGWKPLCMGFRV